MASVMGIWGALMGPKSENVGFSLVLPLLFEGSRGPRGRQDRQQLASKYRLGGGRGRVNPPPRRLVWRFWRFWGFGAASKHLHATPPNYYRHRVKWLKPLWTMDGGAALMVGVPPQPKIYRKSIENLFKSYHKYLKCIYNVSTMYLKCI